MAAQPISEQLTLARKKAKITQREAGKQAGVSNVWICRIERGHSDPGTKLLQKLAKVYKTKFTIEVSV